VRTLAQLAFVASDPNDAPSNKPSSTHGRAPQPKAQAHVMNRPDRVQSGISPIIWEARGASTDAW
jgi:hypothetical protein